MHDEVANPEIKIGLRITSAVGIVVETDAGNGGNTAQRMINGTVKRTQPLEATPGMVTVPAPNPSYP